MIYFCGNKNPLSQFKNVSVDFILEYFKNHKEIQIDTETKGQNFLSKRILTLQIGDFDNQFVIDCRVINILHFKELIESRLCLLHNAKFDYKFLLTAGIRLNRIYDTMLAETVIFNGLERRYGLDHLLKNYLNIEMEKDTRGEFYKVESQAFTDKQIQYAGLDVKYLSTLKDIQAKYIQHYDIQPAIDLENEVCLAIADIEYNGMFIDSNQWKQVANEAYQNKLQIIREMDNYLLDNKIIKPLGILDLFDIEVRQVDINYSSPTQLLKIFKKLNINVIDTSDRTLQTVKFFEFVEMLLHYRKYDKQISTYGEAFLDNLNPISKRIHSDFWQVKNTFRLGSSNPNVQNIPANNKYRNCFKSREGFSWVSIDYSGQEMRLMADFSNDTNLLTAINNNLDIHCFAYEKMTGEVITKDEKVKRNKAKTLNFGKAYGMGANKLADSLSISIPEAEVLIQQHNNAFPQLSSWLKQQSQFGLKNGYIVINQLHKGRRWFSKFKEYLHTKSFKLKGSIERESGNTPIQGSGAVIMKTALVDVRNWLIKNSHWHTNVFMICTVHDELNLEIKDELLAEIVPHIERLMVQAGNKFVTKVNMDIDTTITKQWNK